MSINELKYKIKGNESFSIREGWLAKGLFALEENKYVFSEKTAMDKLGVGSKIDKVLAPCFSSCGRKERKKC